MWIHVECSSRGEKFKKKVKKSSLLLTSLLITPLIFSLKREQRFLYKDHDSIGKKGKEIKGLVGMQQHLTGEAMSAKSNTLLPATSLLTAFLVTGSPLAYTT